MSATVLTVASALAILAWPALAVAVLGVARIFIAFAEIEFDLLEIGTVLVLYSCFPWSKFPAFLCKLVHHYLRLK